MKVGQEFKLTFGGLACQAKSSYLYKRDLMPRCDSDRSREP